MKDLTAKYRSDLRKRIKEGPAYLQNQYLVTEDYIDKKTGKKEQRLLLEDVLDVAETGKLNDYFNAVNNTLINPHLGQLETKPNGRTGTGANGHDYRRADGNMESQITFVQRSHAAVKLVDREVQKKQADVLHFGKVHGMYQTTADSERWQKTYSGKIVAFKYDIRKRIGEVILSYMLVFKIGPQV